MAAKRVQRGHRREAEEELRAEVIAGHIPADLVLQSSDDPPLFSPDHEFTCADCGRREIWTAEKQRRWSRAAHGPIFSRAFRCRACREARRTRPRQDA